MERPELRRGFRHTHLKGWVADTRDMLVWAALTLIQAWVSEGRPAGDRTLGMFESWAEVMGGILRVIGVPGFLGNLDDLRVRTDTESRNLATFVHNWREKFGDRAVGVADLWGIAEDLDLGDKDDHARKNQLGRLLDTLRDRQIAGYRMEHLGERQHAQVYRLSAADGSADRRKGDAPIPQEPEDR